MYSCNSLYFAGHPLYYSMMIRSITFLLCCLPVLLQAQSNLSVEVTDKYVRFTSTSAFGLRGTRTQILRPRDIATFKYLGGPFSKDKYQVYYYTDILQEADPASFFCLASQENLYQEFNLFPRMKSIIGADDQALYFMPTYGSIGEYVQDVTQMDRKAFSVISVMDSISGCYLVKNNDSLYFITRDMYDRANVVPADADLKEKHLKLLGGGYYLKGQLLCYLFSPIYQVKPGSMQVYGQSKYITDGKKVYYYKYKLETLPVDYKTFKVHPVYNAFAMDKNHYYLNGEEISPSFYSYEVAKEIFGNMPVGPDKHRQYLRMCMENY